MKTLDLELSIVSPEFHQVLCPRNSTGPAYGKQAMINESLYWKEELFRNARWLVEALNKKRWTERSFSKLEKSIMMSAYAIRKLNEASKVPPEYMEKDISVGLFNRKKSVMDKLNNHSIEKHYELSNGKVSSIKVKYLFNQIIHSYIFCPVFEEKNRLSGILINSDKSCKHGLYNVQIKKKIDRYHNVHFQRKHDIGKIHKNRRSICYVRSGV